MPSHLLLACKRCPSAHPDLRPVWLRGTVKAPAELFTGRAIPRVRFNETRAKLPVNVLLAPVVRSRLAGRNEGSVFPNPPSLRLTILTFLAALLCRLLHSRCGLGLGARRCRQSLCRRCHPGSSEGECINGASGASSEELVSESCPRLDPESNSSESSSPLATISFSSFVILRLV